MLGESLAGAVSPMDPASIIIVEGEQTDRLLYARILRRAGMHADTACDRQEAAHLMARRGYDFALVNAATPGRVAHHVLDAVRRDHPGTKVIVLIHERTARREEEFMDRGAWAIVSQPVNMDTLKSLLLLPPAATGGAAPLPNSDLSTRHPAS